ncbi:glycoside hydrolase N-terminal domain-containing protein [Novosphingobium resinovorum]
MSLLGAPGVEAAAAQVSRGDDLLWYRRPAKEWIEALPLGNGRIGAMVFGGVAEERLQLNEDTLWGGGPYDPANPQARDALPQVRRLIFEGRYDEAQALAKDKVMGVPMRQMSYQGLGDLRLTFPGLGEPEAEAIAANSTSMPRVTPRAFGSAGWRMSARWSLLRPIRSSRST